MPLRQPPSDHPARRTLCTAALLFTGALLLGACGTPRPALRSDTVRLDTLRTRAERSNYEETTRYAEVVSFLEAAHAANPEIRLTQFGATTEGRRLPLVIWGAPDTTAAAVLATGKTRVLVFANIHAGEVEGKEAMLQLIRALADGQEASLADSLVLLIAPIYNADGNERIALDNRPLQLGPVGGMGVRPNAQGLDLNRDFIKSDAPETRALLRVLREYDPHLTLDLHTTDGTPMAYVLTYAPPLHPNTEEGLDREAWERWLPSVTARLGREGLNMWHYGNIPGAFGEPTEAERGWYSFDARPRFSNNYVGLRNRFAFLSEAYSYETFEHRIRASFMFVYGILDYAEAHATEIRRLTEAADRVDVTGQTLALSARFVAVPVPHDVLLSPVDTLYHPVTGEPMLQTTGEVITERMPAYIRFAPALEERAPAAYLVPESESEILELLDRHGIRHEPYTLGPGRPVELFAMDSVQVADRPFQGRTGQTLFGSWSVLNDGPGGRYQYVPVAQPLGRLAFTILEPRSDDGVVAWGIVPADRLRRTGYLVQRLTSP